MEDRARIFSLPARPASREDVAKPLALAFATPPSPLLIEPVVRTALTEDLGRAGDITTDAIIPAGDTACAVIAAREDGVVSGLIAADLAFKLVSRTCGLRRARLTAARSLREA